MMSAPIRRAFDRAEGYHHHALAQQRVAADLAARLAALPLDPSPRILELGCGTGFLSQALQQRWPEAHLLLTDLSPAMTARCRAHLRPLPGHRRFAVMDAACPAVAPGWDLITANLAFQWLPDLAAALAGLAPLLAPGGWLVFTTLGRGTFREWRRVCLEAGVPCGVPDYPGVDELAGWVPGGEVGEATLPMSYANGLDFLRELALLGARHPVAGYRPLSAGGLRRVLRGLEGEWMTGYHVLTCTWQKPERLQHNELA